VLRGLNEIERKTRETQAIQSQDRIRTLYLRDGDASLIRFLTDVDGVIAADFHTIEEISPRGKRFRKVYCLLADTGMCPHCSAGNIPRELIFLWTYVYQILHKQQNPALEIDSYAERWAQSKFGNKIMYKENVNQIRLFRTSPGRANYIKNSIIEFANEYSTLCDRDYKWSRSGSQLDTVYSLIAKYDSEMPEELKQLQQNLPDLADVVMGKVISFATGGKQIQEEMEKLKEGESELIPSKELF